MKFDIVYLLLIVCVSGAVGDDSDSGINVNGVNRTDIPPINTVPSENTTTVSTSTTQSTTTSTTTETPTNVTTKATTTSTPAPGPTTKPTVTPATTTTEKPTTISPNVTSTTESSTSVPTVAPAHRDRRFDGPSFIGGIILASGLMAIGFVSWKFYKARTERNYHTL